ncbi:MAG: serine hydrolase domain-containing protein [Gaiellaceae bacterium]
MSFLALAALAASLSGAAAGRPSTPTVEDQRVPLTRIYRGEDGSALYLRQLGSTVYGFGEHPGLKYAYVLTGSVSGDQISGKWWDVPKGNLRRVSMGSLQLRYTQSGARVVRTGGADLGPDVFTAISPDGIPWPNMQVAGFQATTQNDLDGVFVGDDASHHYVRETGSDTVWFAERASQPGERPGWATVFIGKRSGSGTSFAGTAVDIPKGIELRSGPFGAALVGAKRDLLLQQPNSPRTKSLTPDYAIDWARFAFRIDSVLRGRVVGYAYAIARDGAFVRSGAGGLRRLGIDGGARSFTTKTQAQTASAVKTINATALIKALKARGLDVDTKVKGFLPKCLSLGKSMSTLTFRQILTHTSQLPLVNCNGGSPYDCLVKMLAEGRTQPAGYKYNTHAYDLIRWFVPLINDTAGMKAQFELFDCKNRSGILNKKVSEKFARYVFDEVLDPAGAKASHYPSGDFSLNYDFADQSKKGEAPRIDYFERAGGGKLTMSVLDYVRFLSALERGEIVSKSLVESMKSGKLGFDTSWNGRAAGGYPWKNGGCPDFENKGRGCQTAAMIFPSGIVAYVAVNSKNNSFSGSIQGVLANAFDVALK